jgi:hypothetical protein
VLVGDEGEELVFDDGATDGSAGKVAVELWVLEIVGDVVVVLEEEGRGVDPVGATAAVEASVIDVGAVEEVLISMCAPEVEPC